MVSHRQLASAARCPASPSACATGLPCRAVRGVRKAGVFLLGEKADVLLDPRQSSLDAVLAAIDAAGFSAKLLSSTGPPPTALWLLGWVGGCSGRRSGICHSGCGRAPPPSHVCWGPATAHAMCVLLVPTRWPVCVPCDGDTSCCTCPACSGDQSGEAGRWWHGLLLVRGR